jgi:hypothetical protein
MIWIDFMNKGSKSQEISVLRHAQQRDGPQVPPVTEPPPPLPGEGVEQQKVEIFFTTSSDVQDGQQMSFWELLMTRTEKMSPHLLQMYS